MVNCTSLLDQARADLRDWVAQRSDLEMQALCVWIGQLDTKAFRTLLESAPDAYVEALRKCAAVTLMEQLDSTL